MRLMVLGFVLCVCAYAQNPVVRASGTPTPGQVPIENLDSISASWGTIPGSTPSGYSPNQPLIGCGVQYVSGLTFTVGACTYTIAGITYTSPITTLTSDAADATNPRIDSIIACADAVSPCAGSNTVVILKGTAGTPDSVPVPDPSTQIEITHYEILALATTPNNVSAVTIYDENTEWACSGSGSVNSASTVNPYHLTKDITITNGALNNTFTLVKPAAGTVDLATVNFLTLFVQSLGAWPTGGGGANAARTLTLQWLNGPTVKGNAVTLRSGVFGFDSSNTSAYQMVAIPTSLFNINGIPVTSLKGTISGNSGSSTISLRIDFITLQSGFGPSPVPSNVLTNNGMWNAAAAYPVNAVVTNAAGIGFEALVANTNVPLSNTTTWQSLGSVPGNFGGIFNTSIDCTGSTVIATNAIAYTPTVKTACTIVGWDITAVDASGNAPGTVTAKVLRVNGGTAKPTASINTSGISLTTGTYLNSSTISDFTSTAIAVGDHMAVQITAPGTAVCATVNIQCNKLP
jgi:hypothetical protein